MLQLAKLNETVTISRDKLSVSLDARGSAFSTVLTREQIDALPDDPDEMEEALKALAPPGATIRVDGFTGGRLPAKAQIRVDPAPAHRLVCRAEPRRDDQHPVHRHPDDARSGPDAGERGHQLPRQRA